MQLLDGFEYRGISLSLPAPTPSLFLIPSSPSESLEQAGAARTNTKRLPFTSLYVQDRSCSQKFASKLFSQLKQKIFKENYYQRSIEDIANFAKMAKVTRIFLATWKEWATNMAKIARRTNLTNSTLTKRKGQEGLREVREFRKNLKNNKNFSCHVKRLSKKYGKNQEQ